MAILAQPLWIRHGKALIASVNGRPARNPVFWLDHENKHMFACSMDTVKCTNYSARVGTDWTRCVSIYFVDLNGAGNEFAIMRQELAIFKLLTVSETANRFGTNSRLRHSPNWAPRNDDDRPSGCLKSERITQRIDRRPHQAIHLPICQGLRHWHPWFHRFPLELLDYRLLSVEHQYRTVKNFSNCTIFGPDWNCKDGRIDRRLQIA